MKKTQGLEWARALKYTVIIWALLMLFVGFVSCASTKLTKDSTFAQKASAVCSDLDAAVMLAQIGLTYAQQSNWAFDYSKAQIILTEANATIVTTCAIAKTEADLLAVRNTVLAALAKAQKQQAEASKW